MKIGDIVRYHGYGGFKCLELFMVVDIKIGLNRVTVEDTQDGTLETWDHENAKVVQAWPG